MNENDQSSSTSSIKNFFWNFPVIGRIFKSVSSGLSAVKKIKDFFIGNNKTPNGLPRIILYVAVFSGISATVVSAMIEYKVMVSAYNVSPNIISLPLEVLKFSWKLLFQDIIIPIWDFIYNLFTNGEKITETTTIQQESTAQQVSLKKSLLPLLTVVGFEGAKCILILYRHSTQQKSFWSGLLRWFLVGISLICSLIFFAQLMNKPHEDAVNEESETKRSQFKEEMEEHDVELTELKDQETEFKSRIEKLQKDRDYEILHGNYGRDAGPGKVSDGILEQIKYERTEMEKVMSKIKEKRVDIDEEVDEKIEEQIRKGGRALDPKWMSAILSALHEARYSDSKGNYPRRWAVAFFGFFSVIISVALELIISEMFKRVAKEISSHSGAVAS